jgi:hypothetical protein
VFLKQLQTGTDLAQKPHLTSPTGFRNRNRITQL